ncbi:MAG: EscU/YscU/HrcU family type III secretion system export apparatus switch protein, partial [Dehalococcoidia bacterium]|nr:EscU/YscU/HrcU family type III secretion system export apparatus switch protein [Dehalococcoidia bacterium]
MSAERSEAPTPRRREDARKKGNVARSQDLVSVGTLLVAVIGMRFAGPALWGDMQDILGEGLSNQSDQELTASTAYQLARDSGVRMLMALAPLFAMVMLAGVALNLGQTGLMFSGSGIKPKMNVLNPASGAKKLFGKEATVSLAKALAKMGTITVVVYMTMKGQLAAIAGMSLETPAQATAHMAQLGFDIAIRAAVVLFLIGVADWAWQRRQWMSNLKMTKEEVRQEIKETDGDPQVKAAIRRRRNALLNRMIASVPKADVVVTNPTHF